MAVAGKAIAAIQELVKRGVSPNEIYQKTGYKRGIDGKWLDMSQQERMGRAREQGFGEQTLYHGTAEDIDKFEKPITWVTTNKGLSDEYALQSGWRKEQKEKGNVWRSGGDPDSVEPPGGENVVPVLSSAKNPVEFVHAEQRKSITEFLSEVMGQSKGFKDRGRALSLYEDLTSKYGDMKTEQFEYWQDPNVAKFIDEMGFDSIKVKERGSDTFGILNPKNIRSTNAAFDPAAKESANLLASAAPVAVGLAGLSQTGESEAGPIQSAIRKAFPDLKLDIRESGDNVIVDRIVVPEGERNKGTGTAAIDMINKLAAQEGKQVALTPSSDFGGNKKKLESFYKRMGFVPNKGRSRDLSISESMIRPLSVGGAGLAGLASTPDQARAASTGTIEAAQAPWLSQAGNYMRRLELPIVGRPLEGLADWAEGAAYQDPGKLKRAAIGALDVM